MCKLEKCCFCIELPRGAQILGWIGIISNLISMLICGLIILFYKNIVDEIGHYEYAMNQEKLKVEGYNNFTGSNITELLREHQTGFLNYELLSFLI